MGGGAPAMICGGGGGVACVVGRHQVDVFE
eukprot:COSAG04_NODE_18921_length_429_cov_0.796970_1_plen_29_part_10